MKLHSDITNKNAINTFKTIEKRFIEKHGNKYNYDNSVFKGLLHKIEIYCNSCEESFKQLANSHLRGRGCLKCYHKSKIKWTKEKLTKEALKYGTKSEFQYKSVSAYNIAIRQNILDDICSHMESLRHIWTEQEIINEAKKYNYPKDFEKGSPKAYQSARHRKILKKVCSHMDTKLNTMSDDELAIEAKKYNTRIDFINGSQNAYSQAKRRKILRKICSHMKRGHIGYNPDKIGYLYYLSINNGTAYKIGITNRSIEERFSNDELKIIKILKVTKYENGYECYDKEQEILKEFSYAKYKGDNLLVAGNTELFDRDILLLDNNTQKGVDFIQL